MGAQKLTDDKYYGMYIPERDLCLKTFKHINEKYKKKKLIKCCVCGDVDYVAFDEPNERFDKLEGTDKYVCRQCSSGELLSHEEAMTLDESLGIKSDKYRYRDPGRVMPERFLYSFDESKRYSKQSTLLLRDFLLENDIETYNNYKDLIEEAVANNARYDV